MHLLEITQSALVVRSLTFYFNNTGDKSKVIAVTNLGTVGWQSFDQMHFMVVVT